MKKLLTAFLLAFASLLFIFPNFVLAQTDLYLEDAFICNDFNIAYRSESTVPVSSATNVQAVSRKNITDTLSGRLWVEQAEFPSFSPMKANFQQALLSLIPSSLQKNMGFGEKEFNTKITHTVSSKDVSSKDQSGKTLPSEEKPETTFNQPGWFTGTILRSRVLCSFLGTCPGLKSLALGIAGEEIVPTIAPEPTGPPPPGDYSKLGTYNNPGQGLFQCHDNSLAGRVDYLKGGGIAIKWKDYQPTNPNSLDQTKLNELIERMKTLKNNGKKIYFHFVAYEMFNFPATLNSFPDWLNIDDDQPETDQIEMIRVYIKHVGGTPKFYYFPAPWGTKYQQKFGNFLKLLSQAIEENDLSDTLEYIEPAAGGFWGSTHLHFQNDQELNQYAQAAGCSENDWACLGRKYTAGVNELMGVYLAKFPRQPIMIISGNCNYTECSYRGLPNLLEEYGLRVMYKGAGLGLSSESVCGLRDNFLRPVCKYPSEAGNLTKCGEEPWLGSVLCNCGPAFDPQSTCGKNYQEVYEESLKKDYASYYCIYTCDLNCSDSQATNQLVANHLGAQIKLADFNLSATTVTANQPLQINFTWQNSGSTALIAPLKQGKKWLASSYKLFFEFVREGRVVHYQEFEINPPTHTWQPIKRSVESIFEVQTSLNFNIPNIPTGTYKLYVGLTDPNNEGERFALINLENNQNGRYLLTNSLVISSEGGGILSASTSLASLGSSCPDGQEVLGESVSSHENPQQNFAVQTWLEKVIDIFEDLIDHVFKRKTTEIANLEKFSRGPLKGGKSFNEWTADFSGAFIPSSISLVGNATVKGDEGDFWLSAGYTPQGDENLNYTLGRGRKAFCMQQCGLYPNTFDISTLFSFCPSCNSDDYPLDPDFGTGVDDIPLDMSLCQRDPNTNACDYYDPADHPRCDGDPICESGRCNPYEYRQRETYTDHGCTPPYPTEHCNDPAVCQMVTFQSNPAGGFGACQYQNATVCVRTDRASIGSCAAVCNWACCAYQ